MGDSAYSGRFGSRGSLARQTPPTQASLPTARRWRPALIASRHWRRVARQVFAELPGAIAVRAVERSAVQVGAEASDGPGAAASRVSCWCSATREAVSAMILGQRSAAVGGGVFSRRCRHRGGFVRGAESQGSPGVDADAASRSPEVPCSWRCDCGSQNRHAAPGTRARLVPSHGPRSAGRIRKTKIGTPSNSTTMCRTSSTGCGWTEPWSIRAAISSSPDDGLDDAQQAKLEHICRKLLLRPGERFLDIGCGWGALVIHAAQHYGVLCPWGHAQREAAERRAPTNRGSGTRGSSDRRTQGLSRPARHESNTTRWRASACSSMSV